MSLIDSQVRTLSLSLSQIATLRPLYEKHHQRGKKKFLNKQSISYSGGRSPPFLRRQSHSGRQTPCSNQKPCNDHQRNPMQQTTNITERTTILSFSDNLTQPSIVLVKDFSRLSLLTSSDVYYLDFSNKWYYNAFSN